MQQSLEQYSINEQSDFYNYLIDINAFKRPKTYRDTSLVYDMYRNCIAWIVALQANM